MKVYLLTGESFPNGMAAVSRIKSYAQAIKDNDIEVEILIYRRTELYGRHTNNTEAFGKYNSIPFRYIPGTPKRSRFRPLRYINDKLDIIKSIKFLRRVMQNGDVLFLYMTKSPSLMRRFIRVAHLCGAFCIQELCELPYGTGIETKKTAKMRKKLLEQVYPLYDGIISISDALMDLAQRYTSPKCLHIKVPIMVDYEHFASADYSNKTDIPFIFHAGTLYQQKDGIIGMIEAFGKAKQQLKRPVKYILTGAIEESSHPADLYRLIKEYHIEDSVEFIGYLSRDQIKDYIGKASLVISNRPRSLQDYYGFSTKLGEYLASGTAIITTNWGEAMNWLKNGENAYVIEPDDTDALANAIVWVLNHPEEAQHIGKMGQETCRQHFDYRNWSYPLCEFLYKLHR